MLDYDSRANRNWLNVIYFPAKVAERPATMYVDTPVDKDMIVNEDGSIDIYVGPKAPAGKEANWIQTVKGKGWFCVLRLYSPTEEWYDGKWRPGEIELVK